MSFNFSRAEIWAFLVGWILIGKWIDPLLDSKVVKLCYIGPFQFRINFWIKIFIFTHNHVQNQTLKKKKRNMYFLHQLNIYSYYDHLKFEFWRYVGNPSGLRVQTGLLSFWHRRSSHVASRQDNCTASEGESTQTHI